MLRWHRLGLRCRDLFTGGTDTSWYDLGDENGAVAIRWDDDRPSGAVRPGAVLPGEVRPEPVGGGVYARVVRHADCVAVSVLDLSGSKDGSWQSPTGPGRCRQVTVSVLLDRPADWHAEGAVLGQDSDRFVPVAGSLGVHREGSSVEFALPVVDGWSVLRLTRQPG